MLLWRLREGAQGGEMKAVLRATASSVMTCWPCHSGRAPFETASAAGLESSLSLAVDSAFG